MTKGDSSMPKTSGESNQPPVRAKKVDTAGANTDTVASPVRVGPWVITDTVASDRKNLFCMSPERAFHIATIVSGSKSQLTRFEESLSMMRAAPEMYQALETALVAIKSIDASSDELGSMIGEIEATLARASSPFSEG